MYIAKTDKWYMERMIWFMAGLFTLIGTTLATVHSTYWLILTGFVGVNLLIFAFTGFCIMANILHRLGIRSAIKQCHTE